MASISKAAVFSLSAPVDVNLFVLKISIKVSMAIRFLKPFKLPNKVALPTFKLKYWSVSVGLRIADESEKRNTFLFLV